MFETLSICMNLRCYESGPLRVRANRIWGDRGGGSEAPRSSCLDHSLLVSDINPVNHPIQLSRMTERGLPVYPRGRGYASIKPRRMA